jgi:hypothetical protein
MTDDEKIRREKESQQVVNAYHRVFTGPDGKLILTDLYKAFGTHMPAFLALPDGGFDTHHAAKRDGQKDIIRHIHAKLAATPKGDDIEKPKKRKVIK